MSEQAVTRVEKSNIIFLGETIDEASAQRVITRLVELDQEDPERLTVLIIHSSGGFVYAMLSIYDVMKSVRNPLRVVCLGRAMSGAAILLASGDEGQRMIGRSATVMIHELSGGTWGTVSQMDTDVEQKRALNELLIEILARETGNTKTQVRKLMKDSKDNFMTAREAIEWGLADIILPYSRTRKIKKEKKDGKDSVSK